MAKADFLDRSGGKKLIINNNNKTLAFLIKLHHPSSSLIILIVDAHHLFLYFFLDDSTATDVTKEHLRAARKHDGELDTYDCWGHYRADPGVGGLTTLRVCV